jgi:hypothetical protein
VMSGDPHKTFERRVPIGLRLFDVDQLSSDSIDPWRVEAVAKRRKRECVQALLGERRLVVKALAQRRDRTMPVFRLNARRRLRPWRPPQHPLANWLSSAPRVSHRLIALKDYLDGKRGRVSTLIRHAVLQARPLDICESLQIPGSDYSPVASPDARLVALPRRCLCSRVLGGAFQPAANGR